MDLWFVNILAGVALILFGARFLRKGFDRLFGQSLVFWLQKMTARRLRSFFAGMIIATVAPSSTTLALVAVRMLRSGNLTADRMLAVFLGANVGMTVMVQLLAFKIANAFSFFLVTGVFAFQFLKKATQRGIGQCLLALGFIFMGIHLISITTSAIPPDGLFGQVLELLASRLFLLILVSALIALLLQSSTATIGLGIALSKGGVGDLGFLVVIVLGANVGVACTALLAGWRPTEGKRLGSANLLLKAGAALGLFLLLGHLLAWWSATPGGVPRQAANFHTAFNLLVACVGLPLVNPLYRWIERFLVPGPPPRLEGEEEETPTDTWLDEAALDSPSMALACASRQTLAMADEVKGMLENAWLALTNHDAAMARKVQGSDDVVDRMNNDIKGYLSRLSEESMGGRDSRLQLALLSFTSELEAIGDAIDRNLCHQIIKQGNGDLRLSKEDVGRLGSYYEMVLERFDLAINVLVFRGKDLAHALLASKDQAKDQFLRHRHDHYADLTGPEPENLESSSHFLDMLNSLRRISGHLTSIGYHFCGETRPVSTAADSRPVAT